MAERAGGRNSHARLTGAQIADALALARSSHLVWARRNGVYGSNSLRMHEIGKLGEFSVADWFEIRGYEVRRRFRGANGDSDVVAFYGDRALRIEVKSWSDRTWVSNGRMVSGKQLDALIAKADLIVWCQIPDPGNGRKVILEGWSLVTEMLAFGQPSWWNNYRPQLQLAEGHIRAMSELADPERTPAVASPPARAVKCSHSRHHGVCWACVPFADPDPPAHVRVAAGRSYFHHGDTAKLKKQHGYWPFGEVPELVATHEAALRRIYPCPRCFPSAHDFGPD